MSVPRRASPSAPAPGVTLVLVGLLLPAGALAAWSTGYDPSSVTLGAAPAAVVYEQGASATSPDRVDGFAVSPDGTTFTATLDGLPGARIVLEELFLLRNLDDAPRNVKLRADPVTAPVVEALTVELLQGGVPVGALDAKAPVPVLDAGALAAGAAFAGRVTLRLVDGAGAEPVAVDLALHLEAAP